MIVISCYNPQTNRTTQDESQLTTMLAAIIRHSVRCKASELVAIEETHKVHWKEEVNNCNILIGQISPLLGLGWAEVYDLIREEEKRWQIDRTGNK